MAGRFGVLEQEHVARAPRAGFAVGRGVSPRPESTNIHWHAGDGWSGRPPRLEPDEQELARVTAADTSSGGPGGANTELANATSPSPKRVSPSTVVMRW